MLVEWQSRAETSEESAAGGRRRKEEEGKTEEEMARDVNSRPADLRMLQ
jgi:hypothetical protein